tara:strand:- start:1508 stop:2122 length:615 start_codon:yes stop_codon:yes gene_type:complete
MANSKVNTEELIVRNYTDAPANADVNSLRLYTNGTYLYHKNSSGTITNLSTGGSAGFDETVDTITIGNNTGMGVNSIHLIAGNSGSDLITIGSGNSGETTPSNMTETVTVHSGSETEIHSLSIVNVESPTINIGADSSATGAHTINIGANTAYPDIINIGGSGGGVDQVTIQAEKLVLLNLPTSDPAVSGALWNDSGTLKISAG